MTLASSGRALRIRNSTSFVALTEFRLGLRCSLHPYYRLRCAHCPLRCTDAFPLKLAEAWHAFDWLTSSKNARPINTRFHKVQPSSPEQEILGPVLGGCLGVAFFVVWIGAIIFGCLNLKRAGYSPHLMWLAAFVPMGFVLFFVSLFLVRAQEEEEKAAALRRQEEERFRQANESRLTTERMEREAQERRHAAEWRRHVAEERHAAEQQRLSSQLATLMSNSQELAAKLPVLVQSAETLLDDAQVDFAEGALIPFWEKIEESATCLGTLEMNVQNLINNAQFYRRDASRLEQSPPHFQIGLDVLPDGGRTHERMRSIVRQAHKSADFAKIYEMRRIHFEQRKTNTLLDAGFSTLEQAFHELGGRLNSSLNELATSMSIEISKLGADISHSHWELASTVSEQSKRSREQAARDAKARREQADRHARDASAKLENIQRRGKPFPPGFRDDEY